MTINSKDIDQESSDYRKSHLGKDKGESYHAMFVNNQYRRMVWDFEKIILDRIINSYFNGSNIRHLDFACGTGRILNYLANRSTESVGVDLSTSMLDIARNNNLSSEIIEADLTKYDVLGDRRFNLITAFRFFPNAQPTLRTQVIHVLERHLSDDGYLVLNNHRNTSCARNRVARLLGGGYLDGMSLDEVRSLIAKANLKIIDIHPVSIFPSSENRLLLPIFLLRQTEAILCNIRPLRNFAENLIFICQRS
jgi:predicted TPR repeat methyltransferase